MPMVVACPSRAGPSGNRRSFAETDYAALLDAAHQQLRGPIVVIWDNLDTHISAKMRELIAARDWLHVIRLPPYAPDLNPVEQVWSHLKRSLGNLIVHGIDQLAAIMSVDQKLPAPIHPGAPQDRL
jgi:putative transposase